MKYIEQIIKKLAILAIIIYKAIFSPWMGGCCRYIPSCSDYALEGFRVDSFIKALLLSILRIIRCHPLGKIGYDPYPRKSMDRGDDK